MKKRAISLSVLLALSGCASRPEVSIVGEYSASTGFVECGTHRSYETVFPDTLGFRFERSLESAASPGELVTVEFSGYLAESSGGQARIYVMGFGNITKGGCGA